MVLRRASWYLQLRDNLEESSFHWRSLISISPQPSLAGTVCIVKSLCDFNLTYLTPSRFLVLLSGNLNGSSRDSFTNTDGFNLPQEVCRDAQGMKRYLVWGLLGRTFCIPWILCLLFLFNVVFAVETLCTPLSEGGLGGLVTLLLLWPNTQQEAS